MQEENKLEIILDSFLNDGKSKDTLESIITEIIDQYRGKVKVENEHRYFMGLTMSTLRGYIRGDEVSRKLSEFIGKK